MGKIKDNPGVKIIRKALAKHAGNGARSVKSPSGLAQPFFHDENAARAALEAIRWPLGPVCPHCGSTDKLTRLDGSSHRPGLIQCNACQQHFTVTVGTLLERSHVPLHKWLMAMHLLAAGKKGTSAHQLHRMLGVTYKTAWFMSHRIREAMKATGTEPPLGGQGQPVQVDETYFGTQARFRSIPKERRQGSRRKMAVVSLISGGHARTVAFDHHPHSTDIYRLLSVNVDFRSELHTDERRIYPHVGRFFAAHRIVNHSIEEYVGKSGQTVNAVENYFSVFKRGMRAIYQHCSEKHLHRYLAEFDFRYNYRAKNGFTDWQRCAIALKGIEGKRLTYRRTAG